MSTNNLLSLMDQFFDDDFLPNQYFGRSGRFRSSTPALNIKEFKDRFEITLHSPGIDPKKAKIQLQDRVLTISYEATKHEENKEDGQVIRQEYFEYVSFSRSVSLPKNVDENSVKAKYDKGILTITVQKIPESQPKVIEIQNAEEKE